MTTVKRIANEGLTFAGPNRRASGPQSSLSLRAANGGLSILERAHVDLRDIVDMYRYPLAILRRELILGTGNYSLDLPLNVASMVLFVILENIWINQC